MASTQAEEHVSLSDDPAGIRNQSGSTPRGRSNSRFSISRPIFSQAKFDDNNESAEHGTPATPWVKLKRNVAEKAYRTFSTRTDCTRVIHKKTLRTFPLLRWLPRYNVRQDLAKDLVAGLTVGIMNIPQGMAYGKLSAVPHVYGLYTSFFPLLFYTLMGTSRHVSVGTFAVVSLMASKIVKRYEESESKVLASINGNSTWTLDAEGVAENIPARVAVLITVTFAVGVWQTLLGLLGMGSLTVYLSDQLVKGFTSGAAFHVFSSQLKPVFGLRNMTSYYGPLKLYYTYKQFFLRISDTHITTLVISLICILFLLLVKYLMNENKYVIERIKFPVPAELVVVICGAVTSWSMSLRDHYGVVTVHKIPKGIPAPTIPDMGLIPDILLDTFAIAVVGFTITVSLGKLFAQKFNYEIDPNQELKALGTTNIFGSFFQCIPATGSLARTAVQVAVGGKTQVVSIIAASFVLMALFALGPFLEPLPEACLGSIIMVALINMMKQVSEVSRLWSISFIDTLLRMVIMVKTEPTSTWAIGLSVFLVSFFAVIILDVDSGLGVAVAYNLMTVIMRTQRPEIGVLGRVPHTDIYKRIDSYKSALEIPNLKIIRLDAPLYFANAEYFRQSTYELCDLHNVANARSERTDSGGTKQLKYQSTGDCGVWADQEIDPAICIIRNTSSSPTPLLDSTEFDLWEVPNSRIQHLIFDCSAVCYIDIAGVDMLVKMSLECRAVGIDLLLAACKVAMRETLFLSGIEKSIGTERLYLTVHDAVLYAMKKEGHKSPTIIAE